MKKRLFNLLFLASILCLFSSANGQRWRSFRYDLTYGVGSTFFFGDLGGGPGKPSHFFSIRDLDWAKTRPLGSLGLRYKVSEVFAVKTELNVGLLSGDDAESEDRFRRDRNLNFRSPIIETSVMLQYSFLKERIASRYALRKASIRNLLNAYLFAGVGFIYFNPSTLYEGQWYRLQPLGTEGQGMNGMPEPYSLVSACFPIGIGIKYTIDKTWSVGLDIGTRYTLSDYIDDVGGEYYNFEEERIAGNISEDDIPNPIVKRLADRHIDPIPGYQYPTGTPMRSGANSDFKDAYMFVILHAAMKISRGKRGTPKFY